MALIYIEDNDVTNHYNSFNVSLTKFKEWMDTLKSENNQAKVTNLGEGRYKVDLPVISCTGSDVETLFQIPFMHVLEKVEMKHTDILNANSIDELAYYIYHKQHPNLWFLFVTVEQSIASDILDDYANFVHERGQYKLISNTSATDKLFVAVYIRATGD